MGRANKKMKRVGRERFGRIRKHEIIRIHMKFHEARRLASSAKPSLTRETCKQGQSEQAQKTTCTTASKSSASVAPRQNWQEQRRRAATRRAKSNEHELHQGEAKPRVMEPRAAKGCGDWARWARATKTSGMWARPRHEQGRQEQPRRASPGRDQGASQTGNICNGFLSYLPSVRGGK